ncbi:MAG: hypothetical protein ACK5RE_12545 [Pseudanabaena sp.]
MLRKPLEYGDDALRRLHILKVDWLSITALCAVIDNQSTLYGKIVIESKASTEYSL